MSNKYKHGKYRISIADDKNIQNKVVSITDDEGNDVLGGGGIDISGKADKVSNATNGNFAGLDSNGNLIDSGKKASDFATASQGAKADTAIQTLTVGTTTTGAAGSDASVTNSGTAMNPVLDFTIPRGADGAAGANGQDGTDAYNPFKGTYLITDTLPTTGQAGDYIYVVDSQTPPATHLYVWDGTAFADSGETVTMGDSQFANSTKPISQTNVINDLTTGGAEDVLSAEQGKYIGDRVFGMPVLSTESIGANARLSKLYSKTGRLYVKVSVVSGTPTTNYKIYLGSVSENVTATLIDGSSANNLSYGQEYELYVDSADYSGLSIYENKKTTGAHSVEVSIREVGTMQTYFDLLKENDAVSTLHCLKELDVKGWKPIEITPTSGYSIMYETYGTTNGGKIVSGSSYSISQLIYMRAGDRIKLTCANDSTRAALSIVKPSFNPSNYAANGYVYPILGGSQDNTIWKSPYNCYVVVSYLTDSVHRFSKLSVGDFSTDIGIAETNLLKGKKIVCFGDSITEFDSIDPLKGVGLRYSDWMRMISNANSVTNLGIGGTQIRTRATPTAGSYAALDISNLITTKCSDNPDWTIIDDSVQPDASHDYTSKITTLKNLDFSTIDIVTVMGGVNDFKNGMNLGQSGDSTVSTTLGAVNVIIQSLLTKYPNLKVYFISPVVWWNASNVSERTLANWCDVWQNSENKTLADYVEAIGSEVKKHHIPYIDLYYSLGWNMYNFSEFYNDNDSTHPRKLKGFQQIGEQVLKGLCV